MRLLLPMLLLALLAACGDSAIAPAGDAPSTSPPPPINDGDDGLFTQPGAPDPTGGGSNPDGSGGNPGGGPNGPGGSGGGGGNPGGPAVPEPGTMLLVGSGLAGVAYVRRRRQKDPDQEDPAADAS